MEYKLHHLRNWLIDRPLLSIQAIEKACNMPIMTLDHFIKERRNLPSKHYDKLVEILYKYGYQELNAE